MKRLGFLIDHSENNGVNKISKIEKREDVRNYLREKLMKIKLNLVDDIANNQILAESILSNSEYET